MKDLPAEVAEGVLIDLSTAIKQGKFNRESNEEPKEPVLDATEEPTAATVNVIEEDESNLREEPEPVIEEKPPKEKLIIIIDKRKLMKVLVRRCKPLSKQNTPVSPPQE